MRGKSSRRFFKRRKFVDYGRQLNLKYKDLIWILDDESYFTNSKINGNDNFYSSNVELTPNEVKFKKITNFTELFHTWDLTLT